MSPPPPAPTPASALDADGPFDVAIVGTGYVGLTTAACLAHLGRRVMAVDIDPAKIAALTGGQVPILEQGLDVLVADGVETGRLTFTTDQARMVEARPGVVMLCLPTPHGRHGPNLGFIESAATSLGPVLAPGTVVVTKSTVPVGTHHLVAQWLGRSDVEVAANPEFLREGTAVADFLEPDRIVIGAATDRAGQVVADLYRGLDAPVQLTDPTSAELIKYAANTFLAAKLSFANELSRLCDRLGGDIDQVITGLGSDHRVGSAFLQPGPGWGGSCFPKDTRALTHLARSAGLDLPVAGAAHASNQIHLDHITAAIVERCPRPVGQARLAVWGTAFKAGTDDHRDSPAVEIIHRLRRAGATVAAYDPAVRADHGLPGAVPDPYSACVGADLLVVLTEWPEFATADLDKVADLLASPVVYDTRAIIDEAAAARAGLALHRPGRPTPPAMP